MANIVKVNKNVIEKRGEKKVDLLKPLMNQIKLFDSFIGKTYKIQEPEAFEKIKKGDKLSFQRRESSYSKNEVLIFNVEGKLVGFIPEADEIVVSKLMDAGKRLYGVVKKITIIKKYPVIPIEVYMEDF